MGRPELGILPAAKSSGLRSSGYLNMGRDTNSSVSSRRHGSFSVAMMQQYRVPRPPSYEQYEARITACFIRRSSSAAFYQSLIDYLKTASVEGWSPLQIPTSYFLGHGLGKSDQSDASSANENGSPLFVPTSTSH